MFKIIRHAVLFLAGAGAGVYWGVHHPTQAASLSDIEAAKAQQAAALAKLEVLQQIAPDQAAAPNSATPVASSPNLGKIQQLIQKAQQELSDAKSKLASP